MKKKFKVTKKELIDHIQRCDVHSEEYKKRIIAGLQVHFEDIFILEGEEVEGGFCGVDCNHDYLGGGRDGRCHCECHIEQEIVPPCGLEHGGRDNLYSCGCGGFISRDNEDLQRENRRFLEQQDVGELAGVTLRVLHEYQKQICPIPYQPRMSGFIEIIDRYKKRREELLKQKEK